MEAMLAERRARPTKERVHARDLQFFELTIQEGLSAPSLQRLLQKERKYTRGAAMPLTIQSMDDIYRLANRQLEGQQTITMALAFF